MESYSENLDKWQSETGAIRSQVTAKGLLDTDETMFMTAIWLRELRQQPPHVRQRLSGYRDAALEYLENGVYENSDGLYGFWAPGAQPPWAKPVPADIDDTVVVSTELLLAGRLSSMTLRRRMYHMLVNARTTMARRTIPKWSVPGCYYTWLPAAEQLHNVVDVCVNTNVIGLLALLEAKTAPGYQQACETVIKAVDWAQGNNARIRAITPYYANPRELSLALRHAIECGANELKGAEEIVRLEFEHNPLEQLNPTICSAAYGSARWSCPPIEYLRKVKQQATGG